MTHYDIQAAKILKDKNINIKCHSKALNDVVWSTSVQQGPKTNVVTVALGKVVTPVATTKAFDSELISQIYAERGREDKSGVLVRFRSSSKSVQNGVKKRYTSEKTVAIKRLKDESY